MDLHHPPSRASGRSSSRCRPSWTIRSALVLAAAVLGMACTDGDDQVLDLPQELVAADEATSPLDGDRSPQGGDETVTSAPWPGGSDGFQPVEEPEGDPVEPPSAETVELTADAPAAVIDDVADRLAASGDGDELLDAVDPVDRAGPPAADDGQPRNGLGEPLVLDGDASLACAQIEIAIGLLDDGRSADAAGWVTSGADQAGSSAVADINAWASPLRSAVAATEIADPAPLVGFLSVCTEGGYEL